MINMILYSILRRVLRSLRGRKLNVVTYPQRVYGNSVEPFLEVREYGDYISVLLDMPGAFKDTIKVVVHNNVLEVSGMAPDFVYRRRVKIRGTFGNIRAEYKNGVLTILFKDLNKKRTGKKLISSVAH